MLPSDRRSLVTLIVRRVAEREMYSMNPCAVKRAQSGNFAASLTVIRKIPRGASASTSNRHSVKLYMTGPGVTVCPLHLLCGSPKEHAAVRERVLGSDPSDLWRP